MNKKQEQERTEILLKWALEESLETDPDMLKYQSGNDIEDYYAFSEEYERRLKRLYKMAERKERRPVRMKKFRNMAAGIVVFLGVSMVTVSQVEAFRVPIVRFFSSIQKESTFFGARKENGQKVTENFKEYEPSYVPEGYTILEVNEKSNCLRIKYGMPQDSKEYLFVFYRNIESVSIDTEESDYETIEIAGKQAHYVREGERIRVLLDHDGHRYYVSGNISLEEVKRIFESLF